jgi:hypothetical protein
LSKLSGKFDSRPKHQLQINICVEKLRFIQGFFLFGKKPKTMLAHLLPKISFREVFMSKINLTSQIFSLFFLFCAAFSNVQSQNRIDKVLIDEAERITQDSFIFSAQTPKGARVYAASKPSSKMLNSIDAGLSDLFTVALRNNYSKRLNYSDYTIFIAKADRTKSRDNQYSPDIAIGSAQYAGSVYDQGGFVYAAGMVLAFNPCAFIIAEHSKDFQRVSDVVRFEGEHLVLYHNHRKRYNKTADHSQGGGHPILQ